MSTEAVPLYPEAFPQQIPADQQEKAVNDRGCINNIHYPTLTVYRPFIGHSTGCGVVVCPGGGYSLLAADHEGTQIARWLNTFGVTAFVLKYRLPPHYRHPQPLQDAQRAIRIVRACGGNWGVKPDRIGIMGFSAGGHLASTAATHFDAGKPDAKDSVERQSCRPDFAVLCYAVIAMDQVYGHTGSVKNLLGEGAPPEKITEIANQRHVTPQTPPTFLFNSQDDKSVDARNSIDFYLACQQNNVLAELHIFPHGGHGYGMGGAGTGQSQWPGLLRKWMDGLGMLKQA